MDTCTRFFCKDRALVDNRSPLLEISEESIGAGARRSLIDRGWETVAGVVPASTKGDRRNGVWINLSPSDRREEIRVDEASIGAIGTLWLVGFYHRHPEMRFELSGAAVLERLNSVFVTEVENRDV